MQVYRNQNSCLLITSFYDNPNKLFILSGLDDSSKNTFLFFTWVGFKERKGEGKGKETDEREKGWKRA